MAINDGGQAFPRGDYTAGMSLRDYFAAKAMQGLLGQQRRIIEGGQQSFEMRYLPDLELDDTHELCLVAYDIADAMLARRGME